MSFLDTYVLSVKHDKKNAFFEHAKVMDSIFLEYGATRVLESWASDVPNGTLTSFPLAVKAEADEAVVVGLIFWPDKATRDSGMASAMTDPRFTSPELDMPFDGKRMIFGGFDILFDAAAKDV